MTRFSFRHRHFIPECVDETGFRIRHHKMLGKIPHFHIATDLHVPAVSGHLPQEDLDDGRLPRPVLSDDGGAVLETKVHMGVMEESASIKGL